MIASGRVAYLARRAAEYGVSAPASVTMDMTKVRQRKRDIVESFRGGSERRVKDAGVEVFVGEASFTSPNSISISSGDSSKSITSEEIFINTGARPARPALPGLEGIEPGLVLDSTSIQELDQAPEHLVVLGGGYIALEYGQLFRRFGAEVTIIQRSKQLLPREDPDVAASMKEILEQDGMNVLLHSQAVKVSSSSSAHISIDVEDGDRSTRTITGSHLLVATGRTPNTDRLDLQKIGLKTDAHGYIVVSPSLQTSVSNIFALGDVKGGPAFTHVSYDDFRIIQGSHLTRDRTTARNITDRLVNYVAYTDPQLGHVGLHEDEARRKFPDRKIQVAKMPMSYVARALETDESRGMMKAVVDGDTKAILGFTCLGLEGGEIMSVVQVAMMGGLTYDKLQDAIFAHPSLAESLNNLWAFLQ